MMVECFLFDIVNKNNSVKNAEIACFLAIWFRKIKNDFYTYPNKYRIFGFFESFKNGVKYWVLKRW